MAEGTHRGAADRLTRDRVAASYDAVAAEYARRIANELEGKPLDRELLEEMARRAQGTICDLGCGPGHVARYLEDHGARVVGMDISAAMIAEARRRHPHLQFDVGDMRSLPYADGAFAAAVAMYSLIHFDDSELRAALREMHRVLGAGGLLLASFHQGTDIVHRDELFDCPVDLDFRFFEPDRVQTAVTAAGFGIERVIERDPYPGVEVETRRFYVIATAGGVA